MGSGSRPEGSGSSDEFPEIPAGLLGEDPDEGFDEAPGSIPDGALGETVGATAGSRSVKLKLGSGWVTCANRDPAVVPGRYGSTMIVLVTGVPEHISDKDLCAIMQEHQHGGELQYKSEMRFEDLGLGSELDTI